MVNFKKGLKYLRYNIGAIIGFEVLYLVVSIAVLSPVLYSLINISIKAAGISYLTPGLLKRFFMQPQTYAFLLLILFIIAVYLLINISALIIAVNSSRRLQKTNALELFIKGLLNSMRVIAPWNLYAVVYVLFVLPVTFSFLITGTASGLKIPAFFTNIYVSNKMFFVFLFAIYICICIFSMNRLMTFNIFTIYRQKYGKAVKICKKLKANNFKVAFGSFVINIILVIILFLFQGTLAGILAGFFKKLITAKDAIFAFDIIINVIFTVLYVSLALISTPVIYSYICASFYSIVEQTDDKELKEIAENNDKRSIIEESITRKNKNAVKFSIVVALALNALYIFLVIDNRVSLRITYPTRADVTAHRGDSSSAPENTIPAFRYAIDNGADIIEFDIRQTLDGVLVVIHDENVSRTTDGEGKVGELTYDYINSLDAGSWFSDEYKGVHVPTFEETLSFFSEEKPFINIELKPAKTDGEDYYQQVVDYIEEYDYVDDCVVASANYTAIENIKNINPDIKTVYIMSVAFGDFADMEYADIFSIRYNFISKRIVDSVHSKGKEIYAWTLEYEDDIKDIILLDVDSVITDYPFDTKQIIYSANESLGLDLIKRIINY